MLNGKHIILGVCGGIAAYKSAFLVRELVKAGAEVQVVMTRGAAQFITPLTLSTLSRRPALVEMFPPEPGGHTDRALAHIELAVWADLMVIAPATANTVAKLAHGMADNFLTTLVLALRAPLALAPAMDVDMLLNETTRKNIASLRESGCHIIEPVSGELASGLSGPGRLPEVDALMKAIEGILEGARRDLEGKRVLVTAGPTQEPIDPVRYIGNRSSGKMGFAVANAAAQRGAEVTLISGPVSLRTPRNTRRVDVRTAGEMQQAVDRELKDKELLVMAAAVADFSPVRPSAGKLKRETIPGGRWTIECAANPDILKSVGERTAHPVLVGFALETDDGIEQAKRKLQAKHLDMIVLNNPNDEGAAFGEDTNVVTFLTPDGGTEQLPKLTKFEVANRLLDRVRPLLG